MHKENPMRIRYENTMDDLIAFQDFYVTHSAAARRMVTSYRIWGAVSAFGMLLLVLPFVFRYTPKVAGTLIGASLGAVITFFIVPVTMRWSSRSAARKLYSEGKQKLLLCEHEVEITEDGITGRTPYSEAKLAWGAIERVESAPEHTFVFVSPTAALIIPHRQIPEAEYRAFMTELGERYKPDYLLPQAGRG
jgi:hypothetical protein